MERSLKALARDPRLSEALARARAGRVVLGGLYGSSRSLMAGALASLSDRPLLVVTAYADRVIGMAEDLRALRVPHEPIVVQGSEDGSDDDPEVRANLADRVAALARIAGAGAGQVVLIAAGSLLDPFPTPVELTESLIKLTKGEHIDRDAVLQKFLERGYVREAMVTAPGEIALRGDVIDVFPLTADRPTRLELFDDQIESLREVDPETQLSVMEKDELVVGRQSLAGATGGERGARALLRHFRAAPLLVADDPPACIGAIEEAAFEQKPLEPARRASREWLEREPAIALLKTRAGEDSIGFTVDPPQGASDLADLGAALGRLTQSYKHVAILCATAAEKKRLKSVVREQAPELLAKIELHQSSLEEGFQFADISTACLNHHELLSRRRARRPVHSKARRGFAVKSVLELSRGDYVVHLVHGVARYLGPKREPRDGLVEDFLTLEFADETILFLPASKIDLIERYVGVGGVRPKLDKLGGRSWAKKKEQVNKAVDDLAAELLEVQALRQDDKPFVFPGDDELQAQFEASFPFDETDDQLTAIAEIKQDLESQKPMDRLICGDVGFGKTEIAIRAAFKAILSHKQVGVLVPTTLLAQQHYETFRERFKDYPITVEVLSRFRSAGEQKKVIEAVKAGKVDVLIGTHRLLSQDVAFGDLGLVIIDEEQRFGVRHKERLKHLRATVDVLTLTATPIPRTLHMALVGLRDISALRTAPKGRMSIETQVHQRDDGLIRSAIHRELKRGGQVFYVCNRVNGIERHAQLIERLVPAARVGIAHGQMPQHELEAAAREFTNGGLDVLVCTTIIESGIDIPRVNTLIVDRADMFGLADLHQLRGRIGRSDAKAHAYFLLPGKPISDVALRRLKAIEALSHLGAGFEISIKDLEIRGAGNILGGEQHGHIAAVGYDLYCRLLKRAVERRRGVALEDAPVDIDVDLAVSALVPLSYIADETQRMEMLRRLSSARGTRPILAIAEEMRDRFGRLPGPVQNLVTLFLLKDRCRELGIKQLFYPGDDFVLLVLFDAKRFEARAPLTRDEVRFTQGDQVHLMLPKGVRDPGAVLDYLRRHLLKARDEAVMSSA